ncbi:hypothetical protein GCM10009539_77550 [Cryptosporangium japonicum]|uniref:DUF4267 domain-containing protein n=2 Tax=Cryptosporangium japonicum TaxID=80872 RepID=A0ABN0V6N9_9ACTN
MEHTSEVGSPAADRSRQIVLAVALLRLAVGAVSTVQPTALPRGMGIDSATAARATFITQMFASREIALALGTSYAVVRGRSPRPWLLASALSDGADAVTLVTAARQGRVAKVAAYAAAAGAVVAVGASVWAATRRP